jgi:uncharacterized protein (TIGR02679 family)
MGSIDGERLRKLLGGAELSNLRLRLRTRYERGASRDEFTLTDLEGHERRALAGLLGRRSVVADSMRIRRSELDAALAHAGIAATLREALEFLDGPVLDRRAARAARDEAWSAALGQVKEPRLAGLLATVGGSALVKRLAGRDRGRAELLLAQAALVLARLPGRGVSRAQLAAEVLGDSHGLDNGRPVATIVLRAGADADAGAGAGAGAGAAGEPPAAAPEEAAPLQEAEESIRERWARLGVTVNELALPALCLNLPGLVEAVPGEPAHLSLRRLLRRPVAWEVARRYVFVCENPNIVAIAADRLGPGCAPLVCTDGMPSAAQQTLLGQLADGGARLRYHGDFDWAGLIIGNFVMREFGAGPWRFGTADYLASCGEVGGGGDHVIGLDKSIAVTAQWDPRLAGAMAERGVAVHEESVVEALLVDLAGRP